MRDHESHLDCVFLQIEKHQNREYERLYGKKEKGKKGKKRERQPVDEEENFDVSSDSSAEEEPPAKKTKTNDDKASDDVDMAAFEKMAAKMLKGGGF
jgi:hypothetical protein